MDAPARQKRRDAGEARATPRDLVALKFLAQVQPAATEHLQVLMGASTAVTRRRLRTLRDLGLVQVHVPRMAGPNWYTLGAKAPALLARTFAMDPEEIWVPRGIGRVQLDHHGGMVAVLAALTVATARSRSFDLEAVLTEREIRSQLKAPAGTLVPDATVRLVGPDADRFALAIEVDRGTEKNPSWVAARKAVPYAAARAQGHPLMGCGAWGVLFVTPSQRRIHRLVKAFYEAEVPRDLCWFAEDSLLTDRTVLTAEPWRALRLTPDGTRVQLLADSPFLQHAAPAARRPAGLVGESGGEEGVPGARNRDFGGHGS